MIAKIMAIIAACRTDMHLSVTKLKEVLVNLLSAVSPGEKEVERRAEAAVNIKAVLECKGLVASDKTFMTVIKEFYDWPITWG